MSIGAFELRPDRGATHSKNSIPLDVEPRVRTTKPFLVITSENIANVYFEPLNTVRIESVADTEMLDEAIDRLERFKL